MTDHELVRFMKRRLEDGGTVSAPPKIDPKDRRYCQEHKVAFSIKKGCDQCRKEGYCPYYGRGCPC